MRDIPPLKMMTAWVQRPAGLAFLVLLGLSLMLGAPLLAENSADAPLVAQHDEDHDHQDAQQDEGHANETAHPDAPADTHGADGHDAAADGHGEDAHGEEHEGGGLHFPTLVRVVAQFFEPEGHEVHDWHGATHPVSRFLWRYEDPIYSGIIILILTLIFTTASRNLTLIPGKLQNVAEILVDGLDGFIRDVIGPHGRQFVPFLGTLGIYIYVMNIFGLIPLMKSPTSVLETTAAMAICVFFFVQYTAIRMNGIGGYLYHLAGEPKDAVGWGLSPLMFPLHVIGEFAKPLSLALRLFGNVMGEDLLLVVFCGLGVGLLSFTGLPIGFPLHLPFMFLALLTTLIQALVFMLLSTIYIALVMPHDDHAAGH